MSGGGTPGTYCPAGEWTNLYEGPTFGFLYVFAPSAVSIKWRCYSSGIPWYTSGSANLHAGQNTIVTGGPSVYEDFQVDPAVSVVLNHG